MAGHPSRHRENLLLDKLKRQKLSQPVPEGKPLACGWPNKKFPGRPYMCPCGFVSPDRLRDNYWHRGARTK